jgi:hypothetical protein
VFTSKVFFAREEGQCTEFCYHWPGLGCANEACLYWWWKGSFLNRAFPKERDGLVAKGGRALSVLGVDSSIRAIRSLRR